MRRHEVMEKVHALYVMATVVIVLPVRVVVLVYLVQMKIQKKKTGLEVVTEVDIIQVVQTLAQTI